MTLKQLKDLVNSVPDEHNDKEVYYCDIERGVTEGQWNVVSVEESGKQVVTIS